MKVKENLLFGSMPVSSFSRIIFLIKTKKKYKSKIDYKAIVNIDVTKIILKPSSLETTLIRINIKTFIMDNRLPKLWSVDVKPVCFPRVLHTFRPVRSSFR